MYGNEHPTCWRCHERPAVKVVVFDDGVEEPLCDLCGVGGA